MSFIAKNPLSLPEIDYTPSTPSGTRGLYPKEDGWYDVDDNGNVKKILDSDEINSKLSSVYKYKGTKDYYFQLPANAETGDVYNIRYASGENHISEKPKFTFTITENTPEENMYSIILTPIDTFNVEHLTSFAELNVSFIPAGQGDIAEYGFTSNIPIVSNDSIEFYVYGINHSLGGSFDPLYVPGGDNIVAFINEDLPDITLEEPYRVKDGDNVAWTGTEWDVLAGTVDMSLYAQTDLSNVDNATFKAKAESAGVGGGSIDLSDCEKISNKTTEINADSTDDQYPSAKAVWEVTKNAGGATTSFSSIILNSSTERSTKQFKITIDDNGTLTATELEGNE